MRNYQVIPFQLENDFLWCVYENKTEYTIAQFFFEDDAERYAGFLERGGAFDGWTPIFMLHRVVAPRDLNQEFSDFLSD